MNVLRRYGAAVLLLAFSFTATSMVLISARTNHHHLSQSIPRRVTNNNVTLPQSSDSASHFDWVTQVLEPGRTKSARGKQNNFEFARMFEPLVMGVTPEQVSVSANLVVSRNHPSQPTATLDSQVRPVVHREPISHSEIYRLPPLTPEQQTEVATLPPVCLSGLPGIPVPADPPLTSRDAFALNSLFAPPTAPVDLQQAQRAMTLPPLPHPPDTAPNMANKTPAGIWNPHSHASAVKTPVPVLTKSPGEPCDDPHAVVFAKDLYPSALECRKCHTQIYEEWAVSSHANAGVSPMFHKFEQKLQSLAQGTLGYFCYRCHAPVGTTVYQPRFNPVYDGPRVFREGVTCVVCHRVAEQYAKTNGERRLEPGPLETPIFGSSSGDNLEVVLKHREEYKVKTDPESKTPGQLIHNHVIRFEQLSRSDFCTSCHQVAVQPGIKLEVVWEQYRNSPAYRQGIRCQDCHMGKVPGLPSGFEVAYGAIVNEKPVGLERKHSNHLFFGPGASIAHPGLFPHHPQADRWTPRQWLAFDWRAGWGTEDYENLVERGEIREPYPPEWTEADDRRDARDIIDANLKRSRFKDDTRRQVLENGSRIDGPFFANDTRRQDNSYQSNQPLKFSYVVSNTNAGHNLPTGSLGAQPQMWLNVALINPRGCQVWETGYLDRQGDLADIHSSDAHKGIVPFDRQLVNYQSKFLITNLKGTDREMPLPVNIDIDQLPFLRPAPQPVAVMNHPPFIRMEAHSIPPLGSRRETFTVPATALSESGTYRLSIRMRYRGEPIYFMKFVDSTDEMIRSMNEKIVDCHPYSVMFEVR